MKTNKAKAGALLIAIFLIYLIVFAFAADQPSDIKISQWVKEAFETDPRIEKTNIQIQTVNGIVTLTGKVNTYSEYKEVEHIVTHTKGVWNIDNKIKIS